MIANPRIEAAPSAGDRLGVGDAAVVAVVGPMMVPYSIGVNHPTAPWPWWRRRFGRLEHGREFGSVASLNHQQLARVGRGGSWTARRSGGTR